MTKRSMTWGTWPTREEFEEAFAREVSSRNTGGRYGIAHGGGRSDTFDPIPGSYTSDALWKELHRLWKLWDPKLENTSEGQEHAASWVSDILGTLGFEWI